jgi:mRNA interferase RelE/StbE
MKTEFLEKFYKDLDKLDDQSVREDVIATIENVESASKTIEIKNLKKMKGYKNAYRIRIGDYRIGVFIEKGIVEFARVGHRREVYRFFP